MTATMTDEPSTRLEKRELEKVERRFKLYEERDRKMREARWSAYGRSRFFLEMTLLEVLRRLVGGR